MKQESEFKKKVRLKMEETSILTNCLKSHNIKINSIQEIDVKDTAQKMLIPYLENAVNSIHNFNYKMKSSSLQKHILKNVYHAFVKYPVAPILFNAWDLYEPKARNLNKRDRHRYYNPTPVRIEHQSFEYKTFSIYTSENQTPVCHEIDFRKWFICMSTGGSLFKEHMSNFFTKKETHTFVNLNIPSFTIGQGLIFSIAKCAGASEAIAHKLARSKIHENTHSLFSDVRQKQIRYFANHFPQSLEELNDLWDYVICPDNQVGPLYGSGMTLDSLRKRMKDWHYSLNRSQKLGNHVWEGHAIENVLYTSNNAQGQLTEWSISQILNTKELAEEGTEQHHCVYGYLNSCKNGNVSIWSLKEKRGRVFKRALTIELRNDGSVVQVRGYANRAARPHEKVIVSAWARDNHLYISHY